MFVGPMHSGEIWTDVLGWRQDEVHIGQDGFGYSARNLTSYNLTV